MSADHVPTLDEMREFFAREFFQNPVLIDEATRDRVVVRMEVDDQHLRPGQTVMGPVMMTLADTAAYAALLARGISYAHAVTSSLHITFLARPRADQALLAIGHLLKLGKKLAVVDVRVESADSAELVAHATVTYSIPKR